jgi:glycosyltransferase involved in cell wall biosynthesis
MTDGVTVLYLLDYADLGGGETSFLFFCDELRQIAPRVRPVVALATPGPMENELRARGIEARVLPYPRAFRRHGLPWFSRRAVAELTALARECGAGLLHANGLFGMVYGGAVARRAGVPLAWTCHGWFEVDKPLKRWFARRNPAAVACVSQAVATAAARCVPAERLTVDYLGLPPFADARATAEVRREVREELGIAPETPVAAVVGRFQPVKGHQYLLDALPAVLRVVPEFQVLLIGDALYGDPLEARHKQMLEARVRDEGLAACVRWLGFRKDARRLLRALDLLVVPSERETFSMVAAEGLEAGVPVLGPDGDGPREIIAAPECGLRFEPRNGVELAEKMIRLLTEPAAAGFVAAAGPARFKALFTAEAHVRRTLRMYGHLLPQAVGFQAIQDPAPPPA